MWIVQCELDATNLFKDFQLMSADYIYDTLFDLFILIFLFGVSCCTKALVHFKCANKQFAATYSAYLKM